MFTSRAANLSVWLGLALMLCAWQAYCLTHRPPARSLGDAVAAVTSRPAGRALVALAWLWLGWHVFVRGAW